MEINPYEDRNLRRIAELELALAKILNCIETSAADTRGSMMAQVCKVLLNTNQVINAKEVLSR